MIKLKLDREVLADKLKKALKFIPAKSLVPAQENYKLTVKEGIMEIMAADSQCQVKLFCPVKASVDAAFCMPAKLFFNTVDKLRENELIISITDKKIELKSGKSKYNLTPDTKAEDWPIMPMPKTSNESEVSLLQYNLKMGIKFAQRFIDEDMSVKVNANGINIDEIDNRLIFTGLDGHNACRVNVQPLGIGAWHKNFVMPEESAKKISSLLNDNDEITLCQNGDKMILFTNDNIEKFEIITTSVNTRFPNSESIFNKRGQDFAVINSLEFKDAFLRLKMYTSMMDSSNRIIVKTNADNINELILTSVDTLTGKDGEERMTIINNAGKHFTKGFTAPSMLNILNCIESNEFLFYFHESPKVAVFITPKVDEGENNFDFLIGTVSTD